MDPTTLASLLASLGYGAYVPVLLAAIGLFSAISTVYPPTWPAAAAIHKGALLLGHATPATPAGSATPSPALKAVLALLCLGALGFGASACTPADQQVAEQLAIDAVACQADLKGIKGLTVASAVRVASTPDCVAALNAAIAAGHAAAVIITNAKTATPAQNTTPAT